MRVGLRRWVESTFLVPERRGRSRGVMVELHHDGTVAIAVASLTAWATAAAVGVPALVQRCVRVRACQQRHGVL
ncbi:hypothetical protein E4K10_44935 [Streptomyces sp. T1317-0309]|nr:hypothetical protein E4K10_44935 [Streptomyces sp. T1317-0309]